MNNTRKWRASARAALAAYTLLVLALMFLAFGRSTLAQDAGMRYSLTLTGIPLWLPKRLSPLWVFSLGNVLAFVPFGVLLPEAFGALRRFPRAAAVFCSAILLVELLQMVTRRGSFDLEDIVANTLGFCIGFASWRLAARTRRPWRRVLAFGLWVCGMTFTALCAAEVINTFVF